MTNNKFSAEITFEPDDSITFRFACDPTPREEMMEKLANFMDSLAKHGDALPCTFTDDDGNILFTNKN